MSFFLFFFISVFKWQISAINQKVFIVTATKCSNVVMSLLPGISGNLDRFIVTVYRSQCMMDVALDHEHT